MSALSGCIVVEGQQRALLLCVAEERQSKLHQLLRAASSLSYIGTRSWPYLCKTVSHAAPAHARTTARAMQTHTRRAASS